MKRSQRYLLVSAVSLFVFGALCTFAQPAEQKQSATNTNSSKSKPKMFHNIVVDAEGKPVAGATVEYWRYDDSIRPIPGMKVAAKTTTAADGGFDVEVGSRLGGNVVARKSGMSLVWKSVQPFVRPGDTNMVMTQPGILAGLVKDERDKPVAGAKVSVSFATLEPTFHFINGTPIEDYLNATTDASGKFRIEGLPTNAAVALKVRASGKALRSEGKQININSLPYHSGQEDVTLVVEPAGVIEGKIVTEDGTQPVPIATVMAGPNGPFGAAAPEPINSSADGTFRVTEVPAGTFRLGVRFGSNNLADWVAAPVTVTIDSGTTNTGVRVDAVRGGILEVLALSKVDHNPVGQISVNVSSQNFGVGGITDSNGVLRVRMLAGEYQVGAYADGWSMDQTTATVEAGKTNRLQIELNPPRKLAGIVRDANGKPVPGLPVRVVGQYGMERGTITTDDQGKFEIESMSSVQASGLRGGSYPCVFVQDIEHNLAAAESIEEDAGQIELKLAPAITITGRAECDGKPIEKATAALIFWTGNSGMHLTDLCRKGGAPGQYEIPSLPANRKYGLIISAEGYGQLPIYDAVTPDTEAGKVEVRTAELKVANLRIAGQVVDSEEKPVGGAWVNISGEGQPNGNMRTDRKGNFAFEHVCEGTIRIYANSSVDNASGNVSAEGGETNVVVKLGENRGSSSMAASKPHKLSGTVNGTNGQPVAGALVAVLPQNGNRNWLKTDANGAFKLTWTMESWQLQNGNPILVARDKDHGQATAQDITEETTNVTVQLKSALNVTGRVETEEKGALQAAQVGVWFKAGNAYETFEETTTDAKGQFQIKCLPPESDYTFYASAKGHGRSEQKLKTEAENKVELTPLVLKPANQVIAGQVLNDNEKPVSGANVNVGGDGQPNENTTTDKEGRFRFKVCEGSVRLFANSQNGFGQASVTAGDTNVVLTISQNPGSQPLPVRKSLKGSPLPDLTGFGLDPAAVPADKAVLLCLFDAGQRPSRAIIRKLQEQTDALKQQGIILVGVQTATITDDAFKQWKDDSHISFAVGRVSDRKPEKWISTISALPWLILADDQHRVLSEGFPMDELDKRLTRLARLMAQKAKGPSASPWTQAPAPIRANTATLNGMVVPNGKPAKAWFQWGITTNYENSTPAQEVGSGFGVVRVSAPITGLAPGTVYHCRMLACTDSGVNSQGADLRFTTGMGVIPWGAPGNGSCKVPADLTNAVAIACGHGHSLAVKNDGTVAFWGGEGSFAEFHPNNVPAGLSNIVAVAGGYAQSLALTADGKVIAWGEYLNHAPAKLLPGLSNVIAIAAGDQHAMALKADGTVAVWGNITPYNETKMPAGLSNVVAIAAGSRHCIALKADGSLVEWGENYPTLPPDEFENIVAISSEAFRCLALQADGVVLDWGGDGFQQLPPEGVNNAVAIGAGYKHSVAVRADGTVTVWGNNEWHQQEVPPTLCDVVAVASGDVHSIALGKLANAPVTK